MDGIFWGLGLHPHQRMSGIICFRYRNETAWGVPQSGFGGFLRPFRRGILGMSPYAYQKASWLVRAY